MIGRVTEALSKVKGSIGSNERHALPGVMGTTFCGLGNCHSACSFASLLRRLPWSPLRITRAC